MGWGDFGSLRSQAVEGSGTWSLEHGALVCTACAPTSRQAKLQGSARSGYGQKRALWAGLTRVIKEEGEKESMCALSVSVGARP